MERLAPQKSWQEYGEHYLRALEDPWYKALAAVQHGITVHAFEYWARAGLRALQLPLTTSSVSSPMGLGSDSTPVEIELGGVRTYLADSMQFLLEWGCRLHEPGCYYLMPSFRGEDVDETHLSQFFHVEAELTTDLDGVLGAVDRYLVDLAQRLLDTCADVVRRMAGAVTHIERVADGSTRFHRVRFDEAAQVLQTIPGAIRTIPGTSARTLTRTGERALLAEVGAFVWVTHWDHLAVPFYQAFDALDSRTARNADLLFGTGEVVGAGERHATAMAVEAALELHNVERVDYSWYCTMKEKYPLPTSGFGMGVERFLLWVTRHDDIRDVQLLPRFHDERAVP